MTPSPLDVRLPLSFYPNAFSTQPNSQLVTLGELRRLLTTHPAKPTVRNKLLLPAFSPATYAPRATRKNANVIDMTMLVFDLDDGVLPDQAPWDGHLTMVYSTWSHTPRAPRLRLVVPLARPIPAALWPGAWRWVSRFVSGADRSCKDASRVYLLPGRPTAESPVVAHVNDGPLFDLLPLIPPDEPQRATRPRIRLYVPARLVPSAIRRRLATDPDTRLRAAASLEAKLCGTGADRRAERVVCPLCGRRSVWFWVDPQRQTHARCNHRNSCAWNAPLSELLVGRLP